METFAVRLLNNMKFYDDPFYRHSDSYAIFDARNQSAWLEVKGTTYSKHNAHYDLSGTKLDKMIKYALDDYAKSGKKRDILLLLQHGVMTQVNDPIYMGYPHQIRLINLTSDYNFKDLLSPDGVTPWERYCKGPWPWSGEILPQIDTGFYDASVMKLHPSEGEKIWDSKRYYRSHSDRHA